MKSPNLFNIITRQKMKQRPDFHYKRMSQIIYLFEIFIPETSKVLMRNEQKEGKQEPRRADD